MRPYVVRQGDYISRLAHRFGFDAEVVWNDAKNAELKSARHNPEMLHPGDVLFIPAPDLLELPLEVGGSNKIMGTVPTVPVKLVFKDTEGKPRAGVKYTVLGLGAKPVDGTTDGDGRIALDPAVTVDHVVIRFEGDIAEYQVQLGHRDPPQETSGIKQRLMNLGYFSDVPGLPDEPGRLAEGLRRFQRDQGIAVTGEADEATRAALDSAQGA